MRSELLILISFFISLPVDYNEDSA